MAAIGHGARIEPIPEVAFVIQFIVFGGAFGTFAGLIYERRDQSTDLARWAAFGGSAGLALGVLVLLYGLVTGA